MIKVGPSWQLKRAAADPAFGGVDGWALFDTVVVSVSVLLLITDSGGQNGNAWIKQLRVLRAFRLFRLLGKMGDLKKIVCIHGEEAQCLAHAETLRAMKPKAQVLVPEYKQVVEI